MPVGNPERLAQRLPEVNLPLFSGCGEVGSTSVQCGAMARADRSKIDV